MIDAVVTWVLSHPLESVSLMAGFAVLAGLMIPRIHEVADHGHPRV